MSTQLPKLDIFLASSYTLLRERNRIARLCVMLETPFARRGIALNLLRWEYLDDSISGRRSQDEYNAYLKQAEAVLVLFKDKLGDYTKEEYEQAIQLHGESLLLLRVLFQKESKTMRRNENLEEFRESVCREHPDIPGEFESHDTLAVQFFLLIERASRMKYGEGVLRLEQCRLYADDTLLADFHDEDGIPPELTELQCNAEDMSGQRRADENEKHIKAFVAADTDQEELCDDFCNNIINWNRCEYGGYHLDLEIFTVSHTDQLLEQSEVATVFYWKKMELFTPDTMKCAIQRTILNENPKKLFVYFKYEENTNKQKAFLEFQQSFLKNHRRFCTNYLSTPEICLNFVEKISLHLKSKHASPDHEYNLLEIRDGKIYYKQSGDFLCRMDDISSFEKNKDRKRILEDLLELKTDIGKLEENVRKYPDDQNFVDELEQKRAEREKLKHTLLELENELLRSSLEYTRLESSINDERIKEIVELFRAGEASAAKKRSEDILPINDIPSFCEGLRLQQEVLSLMEKKGKLKIKALQAEIASEKTNYDISHKKRYAKVSKLYKNVLQLVYALELPIREVIVVEYKYADWLEQCGKLSEARQKIEDVLCQVKDNDFERKDYYCSILLNTLGTLQNKTGRYEEAEASYTKALEIRRELAEREPGAYLLRVADTLNNLGLLQRKTGRCLEAEASYREALEKYWELAEREPGAYLPDVAGTLINLGILQSDTGRYDKAEASYTEALEKYRELAEREPGAYLPSVATTLNNLGNLQSKTGRYDKAEASYTEALEIRRELAERERGAYLPDVADTLNNLGNLQSKTGRYDKAEASYTEALEKYRKLAERERGAYLPDVADTLNNLGALQSDTGRYEEAEASYNEALEIRRKLAEREPGAYLPSVATTLNNLGALQYKTGRYEEAEASYQAALAIRKILAKLEPEAYLPVVADTLDNLGILQCDMREYEKAGASHQEALKIRRDLAKKEPGVHLPHVANALSNLGNLQNITGRYVEAEASYRKALEIRRDLAKKESDYLPCVAATLNNLGILQSDTGRYDKSEASYQEALEKYRKLASAAPEVYEIEVGRTLLLSGLLKHGTGKTETSQTYFKEAKAIAEKHPNHPLSQKILDVIASLED